MPKKLINPVDEMKEIRRKAYAEAKRVGAELKAQREAARFKQGYVADRMGVRQAALSAMESGKRLWRDYHVKRFLEAIGQTTTNNRKTNNNANGRPAGS